MIFVTNFRGTFKTQKRDYRSAARLAKKMSMDCNHGRMAVVEWHKNNVIEFAVLFQNGERTSDCAFKE